MPYQCSSSSWEREENMEDPHPVPASAQVTSAHIPLVRTTCMDPPSCKGGWEYTQLQFCYSSRTDLGKWLPLWISYMFLYSLIHPYISYRARSSSVGVLQSQVFLAGYPQVSGSMSLSLSVCSCQMSTPLLAWFKPNPGACGQRSQKAQLLRCG